MRPKSSFLLGLIAGMLACVAAQAQERLNFTNDILPVLSKLSCNSGGCHGKGIGQNGFKLSLFGFDPAFDYAAIVHEGRGRRVSPAAPDDSLLLMKASGGLAHGGGVRLSKDSANYKLLRRWVDEGLPWGEENDPTEVRLEVTPAHQIFSGAADQPLKVVVHYSDNSTRDVTLLARYDSQQPDVLTVSPEGVLHTTGKVGEGNVMIRYGNLVASARVTLPLGPALADDAYANFAPKNFIDEHVLRKWKLLHIAPSAACSDEEFLRRASLDVLGTLPTPKEIRDFTADSSADKRDKLIDALFERPEYADYWTQRWGDVLRVRVGDSNQKDNTLAFNKWLRQSLADNKPYDQLVREILTASGKRADQPQMDWYRQAINNPVRVEDTSQAFLGMRVSCANCHNHPFENISQTDYWRFAAFWAKVGSVTYGSVDEITLKDDQNLKHPRTEKILTPKAFNGPSYEFVKGEDPRQKLVDWMAAADNPYFAPALCNRLWGHYMGVGIVDPVDDMRATNPPSNPELLAALSKDFIEHKFDLKHLAKTILKSRTYSLSATPTEQNKADARNFARHYPKRMSPHVMLDAIASATGTTVKFDDYPDVKRAILLPNEKARSEFLDMFGRSQRDTPCECETSLSPNLGQVLYLLHSDELERKISSKEGLVAQIVKDDKPNAEIVEELFLRSFSRKPTAAESTEAIAFIEKSPDRKAAVEDLLWTLLNAKEFLFNH
jgi:hypothetical protein